MNKTIFFPDECSELNVPDLTTVSAETLNITHTVSNSDLIECGQGTWLNGCAYGYIKGILTILIPVAGITTVHLIKKSFRKKKEKEGK